MSGFQPIGRIEPVAPSPSLLTSARPLAGVAGYDDWRSGVAWTPVSCAPSSNWKRCPGADDEKDAPADLDEVHTDSFVIYTPLSCDWTVDGSRLDDDASVLTDLHTASGIASALWMGDGLPDDPDQPTLRRSAIDVSIGGFAAQLDDVFAVLLSEYEQATGGLGGATLHVPTVLMPYALGGGAGGATLARPEGAYYRGPLGSLVSPGPGYPHGASADGPNGYGPLTNAGPPEEYAGNALDEAWVYITGPIEFAVGPVEVLPLEDAERRGFFRQNTYEVWGERPAIVRFDPCSTFAALAENPAGEVS